MSSSISLQTVSTISSIMIKAETVSSALTTQKFTDGPGYLSLCFLFLMHTMRNLSGYGVVFYVPLRAGLHINIQTTAEIERYMLASTVHFGKYHTLYSVVQ